MTETIPSYTIPAAEMKSVFYEILLKNGFDNYRAAQCAEIFTGNSVDGVYSHGVNRFSKFVQYVKKGFIKPEAVPVFKNGFAGIEQWDGNLGPGPLNAVVATKRAMELSEQNGIGCLALANTNHWMRGGTYGWQAAKAGYVFIGWTNTLANMPTWGAKDARLGNNPMVIAIPFHDEAIVLDMAMSQFSFGAMQNAKMKNESLSVYGGYDSQGQLTTNPGEILSSWRSLPIGYWKGAGLSLLLDLLATILSGGLSTGELSKTGEEHGLSQVYICINIKKLANHSMIQSVLENIIHDYHQSVPVDDKTKITYPGERVLFTRERNTSNGIPVIKKIWDEILQLR
jgi:3-dehydro-L-gulonate 2-dehydrogenase